MVPPEKLFFREASCSFESDSLNNIVVFMNSLDSTPEIEDFKVILLTKLVNREVKIDAFLRGKCLSYSIDKLEIRSKITNIHNYFNNKFQKCLRMFYHKSRSNQGSN